MDSCCEDRGRSSDLQSDPKCADLSAAAVARGKFQIDDLAQSFFFEFSDEHSVSRRGRDVVRLGPRRIADLFHADRAATPCCIDHLVFLGVDFDLYEQPGNESSFG